MSSAQVASSIFNGTERPAIYATDEALTQPKYHRQRGEAVAFVRGGGTIIFGGFFSGRTAPAKLNEFFAGFELPWTSGDYHRTETDLNPSMNSVSHAGLVPRYIQKALHLANVRREDALYLPSTSSRVQSRVFAATAIDDLT